MTKIALKLQPSCKINSGKRKSKCGKSVCRELSEKVRELSEGVIEKLKLVTDAEFAELEFPLD